MANVEPVHHGRRGGGAVQHEADHAAEAGRLRARPVVYAATMRGLVPAGQARVSSPGAPAGSFRHCVR